MASKAVGLVLMLLALTICIGLAKKKVMWPWIVAYWAVVAAKYALEQMGW